MVDHAVGPPLPERHVEGIEHELRAQVVGHGPAHHAAAEGIQHNSEVQEPGPGGDVGDVRDPEPIGCIGGEVALDQIRHRPGARIPYRRPRLWQSVRACVCFYTPIRGRNRSRRTFDTPLRPGLWRSARAFR